MKRKNIVWLGAALTAFMVTMDLLWTISPWIRAAVFLGAGLTATYYAALSHKLDREKEALEGLWKGEKGLDKLVGREEAASYIERWVKELIPCAEAFYGTDGSWGERLGQDFAQNLQARLQGDNRGIVLNKEEIKSLGGGGKIESLLLYSDREGRYVLCLNSREGFSRYDLQVLRFLLDKVGEVEKRMKGSKEFADSSKEFIYILLEALERNAPLFLGHGKRVEKIAVLLGEKLGLTPEEKEVLAWAALFHDLGRCIPHEGEEGERDRHAVYGAELFPETGMMGEIRKAVYHHHERYDGSGFPEGLSYEGIPFISRIIAVADMYDAVVYINREEGEELNHALGRAVIKRASGSLFDPLVVAAMEEIEKEVEAVYEEA